MTASLSSPARPHPFRRCLRPAGLVLLLGLAGCQAAPEPERQAFLAQALVAMAAREPAEVPAQQLAGFAWTQLCFAREDGDTVLSFSEPERRWRLDPGSVYIAEAYVPGSPDTRCIGRNDRLRLKRKYPGRETIEISLPPAG